MQESLIYQLRKPSNIDSNKAYPALFVMHGMGSNEYDLLPLVEGLKEHVFIFSIRGPLEQGPGYAFFTIEGFGKPHRSAFDDVVNKLSDFIDHAKENHPIDPSKIFLMGFSQGAILSMTIGLRFGFKIKGIIALSGYIPKFVKDEYDIHDVKDLDLFISHGEMDQVLPYEWGIENNKFFTELGADVVFKSYPTGHNLTQDNYDDFMDWLLERLKIQ